LIVRLNCFPKPFKEGSGSDCDLGSHSVNGISGAFGIPAALSWVSNHS
jgi:hypothetical protein